MLRIFTFVLLFMSLAPALQGQSANQPLGIVYNRETAYNLRLSTNRGWIVGMEKGRLRTYDRTTFYHLSLGTFNHPRETKQSAPPQTRYRSYVFGKQNAVLLLRGGWGAKKYFSEKAKSKGVAVGISYTYGPSLALVKPYYLALTRFSPDNPLNYIIRLEKYSPENADVFLQNNRILGAAPYTRGLSDINFLPGANASLAFHMDWGAFDENVRALEIGMMLDVFPKPVPILVSDANSPIFLNFFINVQFGKRK
jgi:hypothetical protein